MSVSYLNAKYFESSLNGSKIWGVVFYKFGWSINDENPTHQLEKIANGY